MESEIYEKHFDEGFWGHEEKLSVLKSSISQVNQRATSFLSKIAGDFPQLTDHSIEHSLTNSSPNHTQPIHNPLPTN